MSRIEQAAGSERRLTGLPIGPGIAIGAMFGTVEAPTEITRRRIAAADIEAEKARLDEAVAISRKQLGKLRARLAVLPEDSQAEIAPLLDAYVQMLGPSRLLRGAVQRITDGLRSAEQAGGGRGRHDRLRLAARQRRRPGCRRAPSGGGARDRPPAGPQPHPRTVPQLRRASAGCDPGGGMADPGRMRP